MSQLHLSRYSYSSTSACQLEFSLTTYYGHNVGDEQVTHGAACGSSPRHLKCLRASEYRRIMLRLMWVVLMVSTDSSEASV